MDAAATVAGITAVQQALRVIAALQLTAYLWPPQASVQDGASFDFIVVGAGSAGCVVANRLTEGGRFSVLLVEAGGDPPIESMIPSLASLLLHSHMDWNYTSQDTTDTYHRNDHFDLPRGKFLSGTSGINGMQYVRGNPHDFQLWAKAANDTTWDYAGVLPYFMKSERLEDLEILNSPNGPYYGTSGYMGITRQTDDNVITFLNAFRQVGNDIILDINGKVHLGYVQPMLMLAEGVRQSTAYSFLTPIKDRPNLHVLKNTLVTKILFDKFNNAVAVEAILENNKTVTFKARKEIILSAGVFNSPQLLLLSGIGPKDDLETMGINVIAELPVGENLQDQVATFIFHKLQKSDAPPPPPPKPYSVSIGEFVGYEALLKTQNYPDFQTLSILLPHDSAGFLQYCTFYMRFKNEICQELYDGSKGRDTLSTIILSLHPKSRGRVTLGSRDPADAPLIYLNHYAEENDLDDMSKYISHFNRVEESQYFKDMGAELVKLPTCDGFSGNEYWRCYASKIVLTSFHYVGTCALGSVLDARLRVRGVRGLRVADASVMPNGISGNSQAPTNMIAEKAADFIKDDWWSEVVNA